MVGIVNLKASDCCDRWHFYRKWLPGKVLAVHTVGVSQFNATARNRLNYCMKLGYTASSKDWNEWNDHREDVFKINTSASERQGNPMNPAYFDYPDEKHIENNCYHSYRLVVVEYGGVWYAYSILHAMGELMNISTILGHADHLKDGIMLLLMQEIIKLAESLNVKYIDYNLWDSGTKGLQYWKHSTGFKPMELKEK